MKTVKKCAEWGIEFTPAGKSYWNHEGAYEKQYNALYEALVPASGSATTLNGELIRAVSRLGYEYCNNGNCNACVQIYAQPSDDNHWGEDDDFDSEEVVDTELDGFYGKFLDLIRDSLPMMIDSAEVDRACDKVEQIILSADCGRRYFSESNMNAYDRLTDMVTWFALHNPDTALPSNYEKD